MCVMEDARINQKRIPTLSCKIKSLLTFDGGRGIRLGSDVNRQRPLRGGRGVWSEVLEESEREREGGEGVYSK